MKAYGTEALIMFLFVAGAFIGFALALVRELWLAWQWLFSLAWASGPVWLVHPNYWEFAALLALAGFIAAKASE